MPEEKISYPGFLKFWINWIVITILYLAGSFIGASMNILYGTLFSKIIFFVGLFVPFGIWNTIFALGDLSKGLISLVIFLAFIIYSDSFTAYLKIQSPLLKFLANLTLLLLLTLIVDLVLSGEWVSWELLFGLHTPYSWN